jgi:hypothetical protein
MSKLDKVIEIAEKAGSQKIEIWTASFKAEGTLHKEKVEKGIVSLENAVVSSLIGVCNCGDDCTCKGNQYEWFNLFEDQITGFSIIK